MFEQIDPKDVVYVIFMLAKELSLSRSKELVGRQLSKESRVEWSLHVRELMREAMSDAPKVGGVGDIIEVDETYMKGRRKPNRGRLMQGNRLGHVGHRNNNYLRRSQGEYMVISKLIHLRSVALWPHLPPHEGVPSLLGS